MDITIPSPPGPTDVLTAELDIKRANTEAFIAADPVILVLNARVTEATPDGGYRTLEPVPRAAQVFRLIPQSDIMQEVTTPDGVQLVPTYVLLGSYGAMMDRWDTFTLKDVDYVITSPIRPAHSEQVYEQKGDVARI